MKDKITMQDIENNIVDTEIVKHITKSGKILRWAILTTQSGFAVVGKPSATINQLNDNIEIGEKVAIDNSKSEMWALMGYNLSQENLTEVNLETGEVRKVKSYEVRKLKSEGVIKLNYMETLLNVTDNELIDLKKDILKRFLSDIVSGDEYHNGILNLKVNSDKLNGPYSHINILSWKINYNNIWYGNFTTFNNTEVSKESAIDIIFKQILELKNKEEMVINVEKVGITIDNPYYNKYTL